MTDEIAVTKDEIDRIVDGETVYVDGYELRKSNPLKSVDGVIQRPGYCWVNLMHSSDEKLRWSSNVPDVVLREEPRDEEITLSEEELREILINIASASWNAARYRGQFRADALTDTQETIIEREVDSWMENNL